MRFGLPCEVRSDEYRVALSPAVVDALVREGHTVYVERGAGRQAGFPDRLYEQVGARILYSAQEVWGRSEVVVKVARPTDREQSYFRPGLVLMSFLHLAVASPDLYDALVNHSMTAIAYETVRTPQGEYPILMPNNEIAGRVAPIIAGQLMESPGGGLGMLLSGIPGIAPAVVVILGAGILGRNAARAFHQLGAQVTVIDNRLDYLQRIDEFFSGQIVTMLATPFNIAKAVAFADILIGAWIDPGGRSPILVSREMVRSMRNRAVLIDFAIATGGCVETSRPTNLSNPFYVEEEVIHYCVPNVTSLVARTASYAHGNALLPYLLALGRDGLDKAIQHIPELKQGVNLWRGKLANTHVAEAMGKNVEIDL
ncbi:MAG: alanine dehydrogenase [Calditrichaeota bacterium]|nr:MAG: alanine dehydrogenase [Calditrichota bacterium]